MALTIKTNLSSIITQRSLTDSTSGLSVALERLSTGFKINHAMDNAANYSISTDMSTKISSYEVAQSNVEMGMDLIITADDSLNIINEHLQRIRDLCEQGANGTYGDESRDAIQAEIDARVAEINRVKNNTEYNGIELFKEEVVAPSKPGYTTVTDAESLHTALANDENVLLANDIDMAGYNWSSISSYTGTLDGNQYTISNFSRNGAMINNLNGTVCNVKFDNATILATNYGAVLATTLTKTGNVTNCMIQNSSVTTTNYAVCGTVVCMGFGTISDVCVSSCTINANTSRNNKNTQVGGIAGSSSWGSGNAPPTITNCYVLNTTIIGHGSNDRVGGIIGDARLYAANITSCYVDATISGHVYGAMVGYGDISSVSNSYYYSGMSMSGDEHLGKDGTASSDESKFVVPQWEEPTQTTVAKSITLQVGINSDSSSQITFETSFDLGTLSFDVSTSESARAGLNAVDDLLAITTAKQTEYGAIQNRLESALNSIEVSYDNLVSSRSTLRDADVAEVSSEYVKMQILQQASATLLATANQSPSIALSLI